MNDDVVRARGWIADRVADVIDRLVPGGCQAAGKILRYVFLENVPDEIGCIGRIETYANLEAFRLAVAIFMNKISDGRMKFTLVDDRMNVYAVLKSGGGTRSQEKTRQAQDY